MKFCSMIYPTNVQNITKDFSILSLHCENIFDQVHPPVPVLSALPLFCIENWNFGHSNLSYYCFNKKSLVALVLLVRSTCQIPSWISQACSSYESCWHLLSHLWYSSKRYGTVVPMYQHSACTTDHQIRCQLSSFSTMRSYKKHEIVEQIAYIIYVHF